MFFTLEIIDLSFVLHSKKMVNNNTRDTCHKPQLFHLAFLPPARRATYTPYVCKGKNRERGPGTTGKGGTGNGGTGNGERGTGNGERDTWKMETKKKI